MTKSSGKPNGGARPGAGRPRGVVNKEKRRLMEIAKDYTEEALDTMVEICVKGESESARLTAANMLLDRGYGRPVQGVHYSGQADTARNIDDAQDRLVDIITRQANALGAVSGKGPKTSVGG